ncbi:hypothetical protein vseg_003467 [Gypsophila vaccaria]
MHDICLCVVTRYSKHMSSSIKYEFRGELIFFKDSCSFLPRESSRMTRVFFLVQCAGVGSKWSGCHKKEAALDQGGDWSKIEAGPDRHGGPAGDGGLAGPRGDRTRPRWRPNRMEVGLRWRSDLNGGRIDTKITPK